MNIYIYIQQLKEPGVNFVINRVLLFAPFCKEPFLILFSFLNTSIWIHSSVVVYDKIVGLPRFRFFANSQQSDWFYYRNSSSQFFFSSIHQPSLDYYVPHNHNRIRSIGMRRSNLMGLDGPSEIDPSSVYIYSIYIF